jgi:3-phenylpropionate/trans-cinnamate dioxygenase ferredoxin reductase subunit
MTEHPYDIVIAGIGISPATALAEAAGLEIENGIKVDAQGRTSDPAIWAAGIAPVSLSRRRIRLESVQNAIDQAEAVARNILGAERIMCRKAVVLVRPVRREAADRGAEHRV